jgi:hypothetical protein
MSFDNEEKPHSNGHQDPNGPPTGKDEPVPNAGATIPNGKHQTLASGQGEESQDENQGFMPLSVVSVHQHSNNGEQALRDKTEANGERAHNFHTRLEIVVKALSNEKQVGDQMRNTSGTDKKPFPEGSPAPNNPPSRRSLRQARVLWKAMKLPHNFEQVFEDSSGTGSSSDSSSESDDMYGGRKRWPNRKKADRVSSWAESVVSEMKPEDVDDDSPSRLEWLRQKREDDEYNPFLDQLMSMIGLEEIKAHFLAVKDRVKASKSDDSESTELRLHLVLQGKDGTGKSWISL